MKFSDFDLILKSIFVFKKQTKNLISLRKFIPLLFLSLILGSQLFFVNFSDPKVVQAYSKETFFGNASDLSPDDLTSGNCPTNSMPLKLKYEFSKQTGPRGGVPNIGTEDEIILNIIIEPSAGNASGVTQQQRDIAAAIQRNCVQKAQAGGLKFDLSVYPTSFINGVSPLLEQHPQAVKVDDTKFGVGFNKFKLKLPSGVLDPINVTFDVTISNNGSYPRDFNSLFVTTLVPGKAGPDDPSVTPLGNGGSGGDPSVRRKLEDIKITSSALDKYRVLLNETKPEFKQIKFGTGGVAGISSKWASPENSLTQRQEFELPSGSNYFGPSFTPVFYNMDFGINYAKKIAKDFVGCDHKRVWSDVCTTAYFNSEPGSTTGSLGKPSGIYEALPQTNVNPTILAAAWADRSMWNNATTSPEKGKPLGSIDFVYIPVIWGTTSSISASQSLTRDLAIAVNRDPLKFVIEVYNTEDDLIAACKADGLADDICDSEQGRRYKVGKELTTTSGTPETPSATVGQSLYSFIVRVIADILIILQTLLFRIFALIIVPVINALLSVHPYEDVFVNIIYPGWLILRNLANIFFIVALLVTGLRILFQQSASGTARGFIVKLMLAALLVNFSLVISQGVVGIADTVQSQFLPENSRVIEALGSKLIVEPLKQFRASAVGETGYFEASKSDLSMADIIKPFVLFFLSLASFCAFIAIAGFLLVRLVALWLLYMTSPIAYVGSLMNESSSLASKWWKEFIKYAAITPILVFFLNIAALMATLFADSNNTLFKFNKLGTLTGDAVIGTLTIVTHFIVIAVIFAGMKFASSSGVWGAQKIVDLAQKIPLGVKDFFADSLARPMEKYGGRLGNKAARALTAVAKPVDFARAIKKNQFDTRGEEQKKRFGERLDTLTGRTPDTKKLGSSLKKAREKMKDFEGDDAPYLSEEFGSGFKKGDKDLTTAALLKMGQEGHFKDMLEKAEELTGNKYTRDAAGLSAMTEDLVNNKVISESNRRDLLNEFDKSAKKKKKNAHYAGNVTYNKDLKKYETRGRKAAPSKAGNDQFNEDELGYADGSWVRGQIKGRLGDDNRGSLKSDLTQTDLRAAVTEDGRFFTMVQAGVFAAQPDAVLAKSDTWNKLSENNPEKYKEMKKVVGTEEGRTTLRTNMVQYLRQVENLDEGEASTQADAKLALIHAGLNFGRGTEDAGGGGAGGRERPPRPIGFTADHSTPDDDDDDDDDEPTARTGTRRAGGTSTPGGASRTVTMQNNTVVNGGGASASNPITEQPSASPPEAPLFQSDIPAQKPPQVGSTYSLTDNQNKNKPKASGKSKADKDKRVPGFRSPSQF